MNQNTDNALIRFLKEKAEQVRTLELKADTSLSNGQNTGKYIAYLRDKAILLASLPDDVSTYLSACPEKIKTKVKAKLTNIAHRAEQALELESSFYMRHLLYPDDYVEGENNELEEFIQEISQD